MKQMPSEQELRLRMAPGILCRQGLLAGDQRPVSEIIAADRAVVEALGLTDGQIAGKLREILDLAAERLGAPAETGDNLRAVYRDAMGAVPCPWGGCGVFAKGEVELTDLRDQAVIRFSPLSVHLVGAHGFYQGRPSRYRLHPGRLAQILDLVAEDQ